MGFLNVLLAAAAATALAYGLYNWTTTGDDTSGQQDQDPGQRAEGQQAAAAVAADLVAAAQAAEAAEEDGDSEDDARDIYWRMRALYYMPPPRPPSLNIPDIFPARARPRLAQEQTDEKPSNLASREHLLDEDEEEARDILTPLNPLLRRPIILRHRPRLYYRRTAVFDLLPSPEEEDDEDDAASVADEEQSATEDESAEEGQNGSEVPAGLSVTAASAVIAACLSGAFRR